MNTVRINGQDYTSSLSDAEIAFMGNFSLPTTAQTLSGAIAEHENDISGLNSNLTNKQDAFSNNYEDLSFTLPTAEWNGHYVVDVARVASLNRRVVSVFITAMQNNRPASCMVLGNNIRVTSPTTANTGGYTGTVRVYYF